MKFPQLNRSDKIIAAILVLMVIASALVSSLLLPAERRGSMFEQPSTFHNDENGTKAMWLAIDRLGYDVAQIRRVITPTMLNGIDALFVLAPLESYEDDEVRSLRNWIENGGILIYIPREGDGLDWFSFKHVAGDFDPAARRIARAGKELDSSDPLLAGIEELSTRPRLRFDENEPLHKQSKLMGATAKPLWTDEDGIVLMRVSLGRGQILALGDSHPLSNLGLKDPGNASLLASLLALVDGPERQGVIGFDEYHHGYLQRDVSTVAMWKLLIHGGRGWGAVQLLFTIALALYLATVRFGPARDVIVRPRRQQGEFIEAAGAMLAKAGGDQMAWDTMRRQYRQALARAAGLSATAPVADIIETVQQRTGTDLSALLNTDPARVPRRDLLPMAQRCHDAIERLKRGN